MYVDPENFLQIVNTKSCLICVGDDRYLNGGNRAGRGGGHQLMGVRPQYLNNTCVIVQNWLLSAATPEFLLHPKTVAVQQLAYVDCADPTLLLELACGSSY